MENWRPIPELTEYEVSDLGRVRSWNSRRNKIVPRILRLHPDRYGYATVGLSSPDGQRALFRVHRLVLAAFVGEAPAGTVTRHLDGNPANNVLSNLAYGTPRENNLDAVRHGTQASIRRTHCPALHPYEGDNLVIRSNGKRSCRACVNAHARAYRARLRGAA